MHTISKQRAEEKHMHTAVRHLFRFRVRARVWWEIKGWNQATAPGYIKSHLHSYDSNVRTKLKHWTVNREHRIRCYYETIHFSQRNTNTDAIECAIAISTHSTVCMYTYSKVYRNISMWLGFSIRREMRVLFTPLFHLWIFQCIKWRKMGKQRNGRNQRNWVKISCYTFGVAPV